MNTERNGLNIQEEQKQEKELENLSNIYISQEHQQDKLLQYESFNLQRQTLEEENELKLSEKTSFTAGIPGGYKEDRISNTPLATLGDPYDTVYFSVQVFRFPRGYFCNPNTERHIHYVTPRFFQDRISIRWNSKEVTTLFIQISNYQNNTYQKDYIEPYNRSYHEISQQQPSNSRGYRTIERKIKYESINETETWLWNFYLIDYLSADHCYIATFHCRRVLGVTTIQPKFITKNGIYKFILMTVFNTKNIDDIHNIMMKI